MPHRPRGGQTDVEQVFLNVPYSRSYEPLLVALTSALVALHRVPRLTLQIPDAGQGRLRRIFDLLNSCRVSFHDLSAIGHPARFNMPFELGLACAIKEQKNRHDFLILEKKPYRLHRHLSDIGGIDPKVHHGNARGIIGAVLDVLVRQDGNPSVTHVMRLHRRMMRLLPQLKAEQGSSEVFCPRVYSSLVTSSWVAARKMEFDDATFARRNPRGAGRNRTAT